MNYRPLDPVAHRRPRSWTHGPSVRSTDATTTRLKSSSQRGMCKHAAVDKSTDKIHSAPDHHQSRSSSLDDIFLITRHLVLVNLLQITLHCSERQQSKATFFQLARHTDRHKNIQHTTCCMFYVCLYVCLFRCFFTSLQFLRATLREVNLI